MENKVYLLVPSINDLKYRQMWMNDEKTMSYNAGYDLNIKGYNYNTGTISKSYSELVEWYHNWINMEPDRYFAYIYSRDETEPIGEIYYYLDDGIHRMGILIFDKYRGKGYSYDALKEIEKIAFEKNGIDELYDTFSMDRVSAIRVFKKAGFVFSNREITKKVFGKDKIIKELYLTKEMYFKNK